MTMVFGKRAWMFLNYLIVLSPQASNPKPSTADKYLQESDYGITGFHSL